MPQPRHETYTGGAVGKAHLLRRLFAARAVESSQRLYKSSLEKPPGLRLFAQRIQAICNLSRRASNRSLRGFSLQLLDAYFYGARP